MRRLGIVMTAVAVLAMVAGPTDARLRKSQTHIVAGSIDAQGTGNTITGISGQFTATKSKCVPGRTVDVTFGPTQTLQSPFGSSTSNAQGQFSVTGSAPSGSFFAIYVQKVRIGNTVCKVTGAFGQFQP